MRPLYGVSFSGSSTVLRSTYVHILANHIHTTYVQMCIGPMWAEIMYEDRHTVHMPAFMYIRMPIAV